MRSELLRRFPDAIVTAVRGDDTKLPVFTGALDPDVRFFGFAIPTNEAEQWSIVITEQPSAPRFGLEVGDRPAGVTHAPVADTTSAALAFRLSPAAGADHHPGTRPHAPPRTGGQPVSDVVDLGPLIAAGAAGSADPALAATLAASHPIVLLPVRVETRYAGAAGGGRELLVRIWPDQVHVDAHDPRLTATEAEAGQQFWLADWRCGGDQERRRRAWQSLAERFDPARAGWIARATRPVNATARPADAVADTEAPRVLPTFGPVTLTEQRLPARGPPASGRLDGDGLRRRSGGGGGDRSADHRRSGRRARHRRPTRAPRGRRRRQP